ncbi:hypothetical protein ACFW40_28240 [Streptomyces sp. NPDC058807]|uniref:hypothetical protein n=1 Tax=unclassified Streptomyces TaxID=2593676 RepID=UPI0036C6A660
MAADREQTAFAHVFAVDTATGVGRLAVLGALLLITAMSVVTVRGRKRETEYWVLLLLTGAGTLALIGANDLLTLFAAFAKDVRGAEAALKYYLTGVLLGTTMLAGTALLYAAGHATLCRELRTTLPSATHGLLGLVGTPPTGVFPGKPEIFSAALAVANTVASLFCYLRRLAPVFVTPCPAPAGTQAALGRWAAGTASLALGVAGGAVLPLTTGLLLR